MHLLRDVSAYSSANIIGHEWKRKIEVNFYIFICILILILIFRTLQLKNLQRIHNWTVILRFSGLNKQFCAYNRLNSIISIFFVGIWLWASDGVDVCVCVCVCVRSNYAFVQVERDLEIFVDVRDSSKGFMCGKIMEIFLCMLMCRTVPGRVGKTEFIQLFLFFNGPCCA